MSYCLNPNCQKNENPPSRKYCQNCGSKLLLRERYRAIKVIGQGGFGKTFLATDEDKPSKPQCVIKQFYPQAQGTDNAQKAAELFEREAVRLDDLGNHPQIPELLAHFTEDNQQYLVQQLIDGQNLAQILKTEGTFNEAQIRHLLISLLPILEFIHSHHVIHRDIKPENIILRSISPFVKGGWGDLVLVDFGAAKYATGTAFIKTGTVIGTAEYIAPEQSRGKAVFASDLYSLGVTCIYLLTGISPFELFDVAENAWVWRQFLVDNPVSDELGKILDKLIDNATNHRYQFARQTIIDLSSKRIIVTPPDSSGQETEIAPKISISFSENTPIKTKNTELRRFEFEMVNLSVTGRIIRKIHGRAEFFAEDLGAGVILEMVSIPGGTFIMGSSDKEEGRADSEKPQHQVTLPPFFVGKYPVTQEQWEALIGDKPSHFSGNKRPVENILWYDADDFCQILSQKTGKNYRLPTEAEWEYACRAGTTTPFYFGQTISTEVANYNGDRYELAPQGINRQETTPVCSFPANAFGLYDLHGNVWEWCADPWHENYQGAPSDGSVWESKEDEKHYLLRGGSWKVNPRECRCAFRRKHNRREKEQDIGFRVVLS
ncbi:MAG: SUMF1/EgtB/PvdO family nonheme iron enzyme [Cyanosarcina radialis HA8281-LM2]|jgi:formylglycine-generating enzyme required for sulfatase activity|nr:SUMF1/EgtB/PvdO family nonheme iron enzyme [Cyanosarcina radialis HA8281-LM2]